MTPEERSAVLKLNAALNVINDATTQAPPPFQILRTLVAVMLNEGKSASELSKLIGVSQGGMSRRLSELSKFNQNGGVGLDLIQQRAETNDARVLAVRLTDKGRGLVHRIATAMGSQPVRKVA